MNVLIFTDEDAQALIAQQEGQHRLYPGPLTDGRWLLSANILTEIGPGGLFEGKLNVPYTEEPFEDIRHLIPISEE